MYSFRNFWVLTPLTVFLGLCWCEKILAPYEIAAKRYENYPLPELQYGIHDLEPYIDGNTVHAHYNGHHETYRKKMNSFLQQWRMENNGSETPFYELYSILTHLDKVPMSLKEGIKNNVGGFVNHALYWSILSPNPNGLSRRPSNRLMSAIDKSFSSFEHFKDIFTSRALSLFGSGYVWLISEDVTLTSGSLFILSTANQDCPISDKFYPLLVLDVWEHAYYLKHQFRRSDYISDFWSLVDWENVDNLWHFWKSREKLSREHKEL